MSKCPHCGGPAHQSYLDKTIYDEDGDILNVIRRYTCFNCGERFVGYTTYVWNNMEEEFEKED
jgi:transcriptional regulator NrdR family protein